MRALRLYLVQRITAAIMVPLVFLHLALILYAVQGGLSAQEILSRTQGSVFWGGIYGLFVLCASFHVSIGLTNILQEWTPLKRIAAANIAHTFALVVLILGFRAVYAVVF